MDFEQTKRVLAALEQQGVRYVEELTVTVVSPRTLYRMKKDTVRLQDRADAELVRERFGLEEK